MTYRKHITLSTVFSCGTCAQLGMPPAIAALIRQLHDAMRARVQLNDGVLFRLVRC